MSKRRLAKRVPRDGVGGATAAATRRLPPSGSGVVVDTADDRRFALDYYTLALAVMLVAVGLIRLRLLGVPFERDEGEYAYMGNLLLHGGLPYRDAYNMKLPGTYAMYSLIIAVFGSSPTGVHAGFLIVWLATIALLYAAVRRLFTPPVALTAATVYALLSVSSAFLGAAAHATHFVNLFVALGLYLYARFDGRLGAGRAGLVGLSFGLAVLMKQQALFLAGFGGVMVVVGGWLPSRRPWGSTLRAAAGYGLGATVPYAIVLATMVAAGAFDKFWFWTVTYARAYAEAYTPWEAIKALFMFSFGPMFHEYPLVWVLAGAGLAVVWMGRYNLSRKLFATLMAVASFAAIVPGFNFRSHYFVLLLPAVGLLAGITLEYVVNLVPLVRTSRIAGAVPFAIVVLAGASAVAAGRGYYLDDPGEAINRKVYAGNPFTEAQVVGTYIAEHSAPTDTIAILGSEPEILVYAGRRSATGYIYAYPMVEPHRYNGRMQHEMMEEVAAARPKYMVYCDVQASWLADPSAPRDILQWFNSYARENYDVVGLVEIGSDPEPSSYYWEADARQRRPNGSSLYILRRKGS